MRPWREVAAATEDAVYIQGMPKQMGEGIEMPSGCAGGAAGIVGGRSVLRPSCLAAVGTTRGKGSLETAPQWAPGIAIENWLGPPLAKATSTHETPE